MKKGGGEGCLSRDGDGGGGVAARTRKSGLLFAESLLKFLGKFEETIGHGLFFDLVQEDRHFPADAASEPKFRLCTGIDLLRHSDL